MFPLRDVVFGDFLDVRSTTFFLALHVELIRSIFWNLKELRPPGTSLRIQFVFDPRRRAILLLGGNKERQWIAWYDRNIPLAE